MNLSFSCDDMVGVVSASVNSREDAIELAKEVLKRYEVRCILTTCKDDDVITSEKVEDHTVITILNESREMQGKICLDQRASLDFANGIIKSFE